MIESIGERIKSRRKALKLSVDELATTIGINRATIYRYESNEIENMSITILEPLAKALHTTPAELCGWDSLPPGSNLSEPEMKLLDDYRHLNAEGQSIVTSTAKGLTSNPLYKSQPEPDASAPDEKEAATSPILKSTGTGGGPA